MENTSTSTPPFNPNSSDFDGEFNTISIESSHLLYLHPSDHPGQVIVASSLTGDNFQ